jgi:hypothetical protein
VAHNNEVYQIQRINKSQNIQNVANKKEIKLNEQILNCEDCRFFDLFKEMEIFKDESTFSELDKILKQIAELEKEDKIFYQQQWSNKTQSFSIFENNFLFSVSTNI